MGSEFVMNFFLRDTEDISAVNLQGRQASLAEPYENVLGT